MRGRLSMLLTVFKLCFGFAPGLAANLVSQAPDLNLFVEDELIIKYKEKTPQKKSNQKIASRIAKKFKLALTAQNNFQELKLPQQQEKIRGTKAAVIKLADKLEKKKLNKIIKQFKKQKLEDQDYEIIEVYPNSIYTGASLSNQSFREQQEQLTNAYKYFDWAKDKGHGAVVAVIDSGINFDHYDLAPNIWTNEDEIANNGKDDDNNGYVDDVHGYDFVQKSVRGYCASAEDCRGADTQAKDYDGHGSHVSGIIAAAENGRGSTGVAPKAKIMPIRASYSDGRNTYFSASAVIKSLTYAIENQADVINMSFVGSEHGLVKELLAAADDLGIVLVAAAGNAGRSTAYYPAAHKEVMAVGAVDTDGDRASFSNYGSWVDVAAPGVSILSCGPVGSNFAIRSGTSMSAPYVAGIAALIKAKDKVRQLSAKEIRERIIAAATASVSTPILSADIEHPVEVEKMELPELAARGDEINFVAAATAADDFSWKSNIDGNLADSAEFSTNNLSLGIHKISLQVAANGRWSKPVTKILHVVDATQSVTAGNSRITLEIIKRGKKLIANSNRNDKNFIKHYFWQSNKDGVLDDSRIISLNKLSKGFHKLSLSVQAIDGSISDSIDVIVEVKS